MLARLSHAASRTLISTIDLGEQCSAGGHEQELLNLNVEELCQLVRPLPHLAWSTVSNICAHTLTPVYSAITTALHDDVEQLAQLFVDLETSHACEAYYEPAERDVLPTRLRHCAGSDEQPSSRPASLLPRGRRRSCTNDDDDPLVIQNGEPSIPTIVITPCPSLPRESACLIPYQDAAFGNKLTVPTHPALNDVFPPLVAKPFPLVESWRYEDGHWRAQLPPVQEQMSKGMFSRPLSTRRQRASDASSRVQTRGSRGRTCYSRSSHREV
ncbi:hypothetical protein PYCCODRAFT_1475001 [Trametes coccinea BRFM310]|uniref:Uncharacterized protein n=1 Tax=Trametes coccinea (strain BRFM310) TaxID=1353009 RepID=A0A1Y2IYF3_TRAC3|nr:hypothetical protein PYCCODRAFT_1475001 [Trametes coccinea BRFM310]